MTFILFLTILVASSLFRITNLNLIEFKTDEAMNLFLASRPLFGHPMPPGGTVSSLGILNFPLSNYILFPLTSISLDPKTISFFIGFLNALAIGFLFLLLKRYYGSPIAFITTILLAFSPWAILFSRKIWAQNFIIPLLIPFLLSLHKILLEKKMHYFILLTISSLFLLQTHQSTIFFLLPIFVFIISSKQIRSMFVQQSKVLLFYIVIGIFIGILPAIPYLFYEMTNGYPNYHMFFQTGEKLIDRKLEHFIRPVQVMGQGNFYFLLGEDVIRFVADFPLVYSLRRIFYIEYFVLPAGMIIFWKLFPKLRLFVYTTIALSVFYFLFRIEPFMHYFIILLPFLFLFVATGLSFLLNQNKLIFKVIALVILISLIAVSITFNFAFFSAVTKYGGLVGDYGRSFTLTEQMNRAALTNYETDSHYQEMLIASYVSPKIIYGYLPLAKMLYKKEETQYNLMLLEKRLSEVPNDRRVQNELIAFYTEPPPTRETLNLLKTKIILLPGYQFIYDEAYDSYMRYLAKSFRRLYQSRVLGSSFEHPSHWAVSEIGNELFMRVDDYVVAIKREEIFQEVQTFSEKESETLKNVYKTETISLFEKNVERATCSTKDNLWCGTSYKEVPIGKNHYTINYFSKRIPLPNVDDKEVIERIALMDDVLRSIRE